MHDVRNLAARAGIVIELSDLGDWGDAVLVSEYDPAGPAIRINERAIERYRAFCGSLSSCDVREAIDFAIAHELFHHREATGDAPRAGTHAEREAQADAFARTLVNANPHFEAFLKSVRR